MIARVVGTLVLVAMVSGVLSVCPAAAQTSLDYDDLIGRLTDLEQLAVLPEPGETCRQWASWDRSSQYDAETETYVNWGANNDGPQYIRQEGDRFVLAEMEGPGCIWRIWSARAEEGHVKIFLDGEEEPAVDLPFVNYFSGDTAPFDLPILSYDLVDHGCRGQNLYYPIPYQKSCKIVAEKGWGRYYQFVYTTFAEGTQVPTFSGELVAEHTESVRGAAVSLSGMGDAPKEYPRQEKLEKTVRVAPGKTVCVAELAGSRAVVGVLASAKFADREAEMAAMRKLSLRMTWDGQAEPAVWCPLGDFFGTAPGVNLYRSHVTGMQDSGYYAYWYMPFDKCALIELLNEDEVAHEVELTVLHAPLGRPFEGLGHFHCKWHRDAHQLSEDRWPDWVMLKTEGRGRFCGVMLHVWDPRPGWWGEGDEKFFVDGEKFPSTFGTGSEDYFGYAWCHPGLFERPLHGQTMTQSNQGHQSLFRWHVSDNIPFQKSFEGCIEKYHRFADWGTQYASTVCWYLAPGGVDPYEPVPAELRDGYYVSPPLEGGGYRVLNKPKGSVRTQTLNQFEGTWTNKNQLWWTGASIGDTLEVVVPVEKAGTYQVSVILTQARDYAIVQLSLDGKQAGEPIDLYNPTVIRAEPVLLGTFDLEAGDHTLSVLIQGKNEKAVPSYMFGLDEVVLKAAQP